MVSELPNQTTNGNEKTRGPRQLQHGTSQLHVNMEVHSGDSRLPNFTFTRCWSLPHLHFVLAPKWQIWRSTPFPSPAICLLPLSMYPISAKSCKSHMRRVYMKKYNLQPALTCTGSVTKRPRKVWRCMTELAHERGGFLLRDVQSLCCGRYREICRDKITQTRRLFLPKRKLELWTEIQPSTYLVDACEKASHKCNVRHCPAPQSRTDNEAPWHPPPTMKLGTIAPNRLSNVKPGRCTQLLSMSNLDATFWHGVFLERRVRGVVGMSCGGGTVAIPAFVQGWNASPVKGWEGKR